MKTNYHTHTTFCDGTESPAAMAAAALDKGFDILGFSGHSMYPFASDWHIAPREHKAYVHEIRRLQEEYGTRLQILVGFEADYINGLCCPRMENFSEFKPDYLIGSVHYVTTSDGMLEADGSAEKVQEGINRLFRGNVQEAVCTYYALQREMLRKGNFAFWGHPDIIRKNNGKVHLFNESESWYRNELRECAKEARKAGVIAEINTGGIARGYTDNFFPSPDFLEILHTEGVPVTIASDAHKSEFLDFKFKEAAFAAKTAGYKEITILDRGSFKAQPL